MSIFFLNHSLITTDWIENYFSNKKKRFEKKVVYESVYTLKCLRFKKKECTKLKFKVKFY